MKVNLTRLSRAAICLFCVFQSFAPVLAGDEDFRKRKSGNQIVEGSSIEVEDDKYSIMTVDPLWSEKFTNHRIFNSVTLGIDRYSNVFQPASYQVTVSVRVTHYVYNTTSSAFDAVVVTKDLVVNYDLNAPYNDKTLFRFEGGNKLKVEILAVTPSPTGAIMNLFLEAGIEVERYYPMTGAADPQHKEDFVASRGELEITWPYLPGAEEYDLEWTYVDNTGPGGSPLSPTEIPIDASLFKFNSTRITTTFNFYRIPLLYEKGYIVYRLRGVSRNPAANYAKPLFGNWSYEGQCTDLSCVNDKYLFEGHSTNLNWQFSANYAEEGKSKVAISYFDGSLRNRQVVSRLNTEDKAIIGETIYDHQGRGAIQVLPVPVSDPKIQFYSNFNRNSSNLAYSRADFDTDQNCQPIAGPMSTTSGASNYYSSANANTEGHQAYLPDAQGYPFTQTQYTPDNTGRIRSQTGVGPTHQLGSGHETKYYYGTPEQEELDRLFGSEAGDAIRYKKNMVQDANGQLSVSYLDAQGKVVATALAGESPVQLEPLAGGNIVTTNVDLLGKVRPTDFSGKANLLSIDARSLILNKSITVSTRGVRYFDYRTINNQYVLGCPGAATVNYCYKCVVKLSVTLTDDCGTNFLDGVRDQVIGQESTDLGAPTASFEKTNWATNQPLDPGSYTLSKTLSIDQTALDNYTAEYFNNNDCVIKIEDFLADEMARVDTTSCVSDCELCKQRVGEYPYWETNPYNSAFNPDCDPCLTQSEYAGLLAECDDVCEDNSINCEAAFESMLIDVSPMGQYGEVLQTSIDPETVTPDNDGVSGSTFDPSKFPLSVFNEANSLPVRHNLYTRYNTDNFHPNWRFPFFSAGTDSRLEYFEENGETSYIEISPDPNAAGEFLPPVVAGTAILNPEDSSYSVLPHNLLRVEDFIINWRESWAMSLVIYHPEYAYIEFCRRHNQSNDFDDQWTNTATLQEAINKGYINPGNYLPNPLGVAPDIALDPYFNSSTSLNPDFLQWEYDAMKRAMVRYSSENGANIRSIWEMVNIAVNCPYAMLSSACPTSECFDDKIDSDAEWLMFKNYYLGLKQQFQKVKAHRFAIAAECYNGCVGEENFNPWENNFFRTPYQQRPHHRLPGFFKFFRSQYFNWEQPCNWRNHALYKDKVKRFTQYDDADSQDATDENICYDPELAREDQLVPTNCPEKLTYVVEQQEAEVDRQIYEQCGQCPNARDLQVLLSAVAKRNELTSAFPLSCYPESNYPEFVTDLDELIAGTGNVNWTVSSHQAKNRLDISLNRAGGGGTLTLKFVQPNVYAFSEIAELCCLTYKTANTTLPFQQGFNFTIMARVRTADPEVFEEVEMEGVSSFCNVGECYIPPRCVVSEPAKDLQSLFNALIFADPNGVSALTQSDILLAEVPYEVIIKDLYETQIDPASTIGSNMLWNGQPSYPIFSGNKMEASLSTPTGSCIVELTLPTGADFDFDDIAEFSNLKPDQTNLLPNGSTNYFTVTALIPDAAGSGARYVKLTGYSPCFIMGECKLPSTGVISLSTVTD